MSHDGASDAVAEAVGKVTEAFESAWRYSLMNWGHDPVTS